MSLVVAIDFDGTISRHPGALGAMGNMLINSGYSTIVVLTAGAGELPARDRPAEIKRRLSALGLREGQHYSLIACVEGHEKGAWCRDHAVNILIDDETGRLNDVRAKSPRTVCLQCWPTRP